MDYSERSCQKGTFKKITLIDTPFKRVAVDIVGPIEPRSDKKSRYILTMIDYATRYPEAVATRSQAKQSENGNLRFLIRLLTKIRRL